MAEYSGGKVAVVANPFSGARRNPFRVESLAESLRRRGFEPVVMWGKDELSEAARDTGFAERFRCVIAAGGDGTLHRVVNTTLAAPIAHYPLGTENLFAKHFGHPADAGAMADLVAGGKVATIDVGRVERAGTTRLFSIVASLGFDADVIHRLDRWRCRRPDKLRRVRRASYVRPIMVALARYPYPIMEVEADGQRYRGALCMVFNLPRYGLDFQICPGAVGDDGMLDYVVFERPGALATAGYALAVKSGRHLGRSDVHMGRARTIRVGCGPSPAAPLELDGEEAGFAPLEFVAVPGAMRVLAP